MKVWILSHFLDFEGGTVVGVYDTEAKANSQRDAEYADHKKRHGRNMYGESYEVDEWEVE